MQKAKKRPNSLKRTKAEMKDFGTKMAKLVKKTTAIELAHMERKGII